MSVGEFRRGGFVGAAPRREVRLPEQPMLTAVQIEAVTLSVGTLLGLAGTVGDGRLAGTLTKAAVTLQGMLDDDAKAKAR